MIATRFNSAQALCLEEMLNVHIAGALFYGKTRRRLDVEFDEALRRETQGVAQKAHELIESGQTPKPVYAKRCESCSLVAECGRRRRCRKTVGRKLFKAMLNET